MDPCDLRLAQGDVAVRDLVGSARPMYEFAIRSVVDRFDLDVAEGRAQALRVAVPYVAQIRDLPARDDYGRQLAGWLNMPEGDVVQAVRSQGRSRPAPAAGAQVERLFAFDPRDPVARIEREALQCVLQAPLLVPTEEVDTWGDAAFEVPAFRTVHQAVRAAGGVARAKTLAPQVWATSVLEEAAQTVVPLIQQLVVAPLPADTEAALARHAQGVVLRVSEAELARSIATLRSRVQRLQANDAAHQEAYVELLAAETRRRSLRDRMTDS
jgi:DNA primase